jgi:hypothetical protein
LMAERAREHRVSEREREGEWEVHGEVARHRVYVHGCVH